MPPHSYVNEWNANANDVMMTWFALFVNLAMSHLACTCMCMAHVLYINMAHLSIQVAWHACKPTQT